MGNFNMSKIILTSIITIIFCITLQMPLMAESIRPNSNIKGKKLRIGYLQGGRYANYQRVLRALITSLIELGWVKNITLPQPRDEQETITYWEYLAENEVSDYLEFVPNGYWSADWDYEKRKHIKEIILSKLKQKDFDLILAFGTWAGQDLANSEHSVPIMVLSTSNPLRSGIIKSNEDSGLDHVHARVDPHRHRRQIRLFHEIFRFKSLGLAFQDTINGRAYAAYDDVVFLSKELGFKLVECHLSIENTKVEEEEAQLVECFEKLAPQVEALYVTDYGGLTTRNMKYLLKPILKNKTITFSQTRFDLIEYGLLMGVSEVHHKSDGMFYAKTMGQILNGAKPRNLTQLFESPMGIGINLEMARKIGFRPPLDLMAAADRIFEKISTLKND